MTIVMSSPDKVGKYRITGVIGEGVSGVVYKAFDPQLQRVVAVKSLQRELPVDSRGAQAFAMRLREQAQAITRLAHPGIVAIPEIDESEGRAFIAMELVAGLNLAQWLAVRTHCGARTSTPQPCPSARGGAGVPDVRRDHAGRCLENDYRRQPGRHVDGPHNCVARHRWRPGRIDCDCGCVA